MTGWMRARRSPAATGAPRSTSGLDQAVVLGEGEAVGGRHVEPAGRRGLGRAREDAGVAEQVAHAAPGDRDGLGAGGAAAAELGGDEGLAHGLGGGVEHADGVDLEHLHREGGGEGLDGGQGARLLGLVGQDVGGAEGQEVEGPAAGVEVEDEVGARQQRAGDVVGDLLGDAAGRASPGSCG